MSEFRILCEVSFGNQSLKIQREFTKEMLKMLNYYALNIEEKYPPAKLIYEDEKNKGIFSSLEELGEYLQNKSISILQLANHRTNRLAEFISFFLSFGRVIKNNRLYESLKQNYQIDDLDRHSPEIDNEHLVFITYRPMFENDFKPPLVEVRCSLINLSYQTKEVFQHI